MLNLVFEVGTDMNLIARTKISWSDHYALRVHLGIHTHTHPCDGWIYVCPWTDGFQNALWELMTSGSSLDELNRTGMPVSLKP